MRTSRHPVERTDDNAEAVRRAQRRARGWWWGRLLDASEIARGLAYLVLASRESAPFALAVDAAWGMGKSSLLFNAWTSGRASALEGLIKSVLLRFDRNGTYVGFASAEKAEALAGSVSGTILPFSFHPFNAARLDRSLALDTQDYLRVADPKIHPIAGQ